MRISTLSIKFQHCLTSADRHDCFACQLAWCCVGFALVRWEETQPFMAALPSPTVILWWPVVQQLEMWTVKKVFRGRGNGGFEEPAVLMWSCCCSLEENFARVVISPFT
jgi:hypothetical protein